MVSVILPIHNEEQIIYKTITSLLYQTYSKITIHCVIAVSYTHLDVYKRQILILHKVFSMYR